jgi:hypothetical protein
VIAEVVICKYVYQSIYMPVIFTKVFQKPALLRPFFVVSKVFTADFTFLAGWALIANQRSITMVEKITKSCMKWMNQGATIPRVSTMLRQRKYPNTLLMTTPSKPRGAP